MAPPTNATLTIVFGELEPASRPQAALGDPEPAAALAERRSTIERRAVEHHGRLVSWTGDTFLLAFASARSAIRCALDLQDDADAALRLRIGVDTGETTVDDHGLHGRPVLKAARISAVAADGEILASALVNELVEDDPEVNLGKPSTLELAGLDGSHVVHAVTRTTPAKAAGIRIVIADDSAIVRDGLAALLTATGMLVLAVAADADAVLKAVADNRPDAAIIDIRMPPTHTDEGLLAAERIRAQHPDVGILVLSQHAEPAFAARLLDTAPTGGVGYLLKDRVSDITTLIDALRRITDGETVLDPDVSSRMIQRSVRRNEIEELTPRELEVLRLIAEGRSNRWIADTLFVTPKTLEGHISQIFLKLGLRDTPDEHRRVAAVLAYLRQANLRQAN
jgi:DNA-binding NarL/FixJ family response regulator/class 3 adenylate cyclase